MSSDIPPEGLSVRDMFQMLLESNKALTTKVDNLATSMAERINAHGDRVTRLEGRMDAIEKRHSTQDDAWHQQIQNWIMLASVVATLAAAILLFLK